MANCEARPSHPDSPPAKKQRATDSNAVPKNPGRPAQSEAQSPIPVKIGYRAFSSKEDCLQYFNFILRNVPPGRNLNEVRQVSIQLASDSPGSGR
jgi:hypothetical protein